MGDKFEENFEPLDVMAWYKFKVIGSLPEPERFCTWRVSKMLFGIGKDKEQINNVYEKEMARVTFDANGGVGGTSFVKACGDELSAPLVTRSGYTFNGWTPPVPSTVPWKDTIYTANWKTP